MSEKGGTIPGAKVLLMGVGGSGKTYSIHTLVDKGLQVRYLALEQGVETLRGYYRDKGLPIPPNLKIHQQKATQDGKGALKNLIDMADITGKLSFKALSAYTDPNRTRQNAYREFLQSLENFVDDATGESFGDSSEWGPDCVLVIDGLSGICNFAQEMAVGFSTCLNQADYQIIQNNVIALIRQLVTAWNCHIVLIAHITRETDELVGGCKLFPATKGKALNTSFSQLFGDVILASRNGVKFEWATASSTADTRTNHLPLAEKLPADFGPLIDKWRNRANMT